jgi:tetratricopeptide (TPR) repeat protein
LAAIQKALAIKPGANNAHLVAGELYEMTGRYSEAEQEYRAAASIPDSGNEMALAGVYHRRGRTADEIDALEHSIDLAWGFRPVMSRCWLMRRCAPGIRKGR